MHRLSKTEKMLIIAVDIILAIGTIPLGIAMAGDYAVYYILFKLWMFIAVPIIFVYLVGSEEDASL